jgi:hypothetical protein
LIRVRGRMAPATYEKTLLPLARLIHQNGFRFL